MSRFRKAFPSFSLSTWSSTRIVRSICDVFRNSAATARAVFSATGCQYVGAGIGTKLGIESLENRAMLSSSPWSLTTADLEQDWSNTSLISATDDWSGVPSIQGFLGNSNVGTPTNVDPRTLTADTPSVAIDVIHNLTDANSVNGGVAEIELANPTVALQGSGTADAPYLVLYLDSTGVQDITISYNVRDIDAGDNAAQQVALQYRVGNSGSWSNVSIGTNVYIADATTGGSATQVTAVVGELPSAADDQPEVQVRVLTTNAGGSDEWVGIDDITVTSDPLPANYVVSAAEMHGWVFDVDAAGGDGSFVSGPASPPSGAGSARLFTGTEGDDSAELRNPNFNGSRLADITALSYSTYPVQWNVPGTTGGQAPYIILHVDLDGDLVGTPGDTDLIFFEPAYQDSVAYGTGLPNQGTVALNTWQTWDATTGGWWSVNGTAGATPGAGVKSLASIVAAHPNAVIRASGAGGLRLLQGFASASDVFEGYVDNFNIKVEAPSGSGSLTTFNFEPPASSAWVDNDWVVATDMDLSGTLTAGDIVESDSDDGDDSVSGLVFGYDAFSSISDAIAAVADAGTVRVLVGTFAESLAIAKDVTVTGNGAGATVLDSGALATPVTVSNGATVEIEAMTIAGGIFGVDVEQGDLAIQDAIVVGGSAVGILIDNGSQLTVENSTLDGAGSGVGVAIVDGAATISDSVITDRTDGVVIGADGSATLTGNDLSDSFGGKAIQANPSAGVIDASGNWWGTTDENLISAKVLGSIDFTPYLAGGTATATGFAGDNSHLHVTELGAQVGGGRIKEAVGLIEDGSLTGVNRLVDVRSGDYVENSQIFIDKSLTISGDGTKPVITPGQNFVGGTAGDAWVLVDANVNFNLDNVVFDGNGFSVWQAVRSHGNTTIDSVDFSDIKGSPSSYRGVAVQSYGGTVGGGGGADSHGSGGSASYLVVQNSTFGDIGRIGVLVKGNAATADIEDNVYTGKGAGDHLDYAFEAGAGAKIDVIGNTVSDNRGVAVSDGSTSAGVLVTTYWGAGTEAHLSGANDFSDNKDGVHVGFGTTDTSIVTIIGGTFSGNNGSGVHVGGTADVEIHGATITANAVGVTAVDGAEVTIDTNTELSGNQTGVLVSSGADATISGNAGSIHDNVVGIDVDGGTATIANTTLTNNTTGLSVSGTSTLTDAGGNSITGGTTGLLFDGAGVGLTALDLGDLSISGQTGDYITLANGAFDDLDIDATGTTLGGIVVATATNAQLLALGDKITDEIDDNTLGQVVLQANTIFVAPAITPTAADNDYTRIKNAIEAAAAGTTIVLGKNSLGDGEFNWNQSDALASWGLGNDGSSGTDDDWGILLGDNQNDVTVTADLADGITILGPGDVDAANLESVFVAFDNGTNTGWTFENFNIFDVDNAIGFYYAGDDFSGLTVENMHIRVAADKAVGSGGDANQNIGIHYGFGQNITISNNTIDVIGTGDGSTVGIQSNTHAGNAYEGLLIDNNTINVLNAGTEAILGIWENGHTHTSNVTVSNNDFVNLDSLNDPTTNLQRAFRITSHSSGSTVVAYNNNTVSGANIGFQWLAGSNFAGNQPVQLTGNTLTDIGTGYLVQSNGLASITGGSITGASGIGVDIAAGSTATVSGVTLQNLDVGTRVGGSATISGNSFDNANDNDVDIQVTSTATGITVNSANAFGGNDYFIENLSGLDIDLTAAGSTFDETDNFRIEDKMFHGPDATTSGVIRVVAGELFVTAPGTGPQSPETIQNAIDVATAGDTINVEAGTFTENLAIAKAIDIVGATDLGGNATTNLNAASSGRLIELLGAAFGADDTVTISNVNFDGQSGLASDGVYVGSSVDLTSLEIYNGSMTGFSQHGVAVFGDVVLGDSVDSVVIDGVDFTNNGTAGSGGAAHLQFFEFNNDVTLSNLTIVGNSVGNAGVQSGIQLRGVGAGSGSGVIASGDISLTDIDISGDFVRQLIGIQLYSDISGVSFSNVALGGVGSAITGTFGAAVRFDAVGSGSISTPATVALGNTYFRGVTGPSGLTPGLDIEVAPDNTFTFLAVDAKGTRWDTSLGTNVPAASLSLDEAFEVEDRILHYPDVLHTTHGSFKGFVEVLDGQAFATASFLPGNSSITRAIDVVDALGTVHVDAGTYVEDVIVDRSVSVLGVDQNTTTVSGAIGGADGATFRISASSVEIAGFTITREGNTPALWNDPGLNFAGVAVQGQAITGMLIRDNIITGNRTAIDVNNSNGHTIRNNEIVDNRTGLFFRNQTDNLTVTQNEITDNTTVGVLFLDASGGSNVPVQTALNSTFFNNNISGNWYGQIVDRQTGGSLPAPGTTNLKDFSGNYLGADSPVITTANSAEPGYAAQIPSWAGGAATDPGGQPDIAGAASGNIDINAYLDSGVDTDPLTFGFQGDFSALHATAAGAQTGLPGRLTEAVALLDDSGLGGGTLFIHPGSYTDTLDTTGNQVTVEPGSSPGQVILNGNIELDGDDTLVVELAGTSAATDYDNIVVTGTIDLGGATLDLSLDFVPFPGDSFTILDNDLADAVVNEFAGLPEGSVITLGGFPLTLTYEGGDGNDVVLSIEQPTIVYVDADWTGTTAGDDPDGAGLGTSYGYDSFATIQDAIDAVATGGQVIVYGDTYDEILLVDKSVALTAQADPDSAETEVILTSTTGTNNKVLMQVVADDVTIDGFHLIVDRAHASGGIAASNVAQPDVNLIGGSFDDLTLTDNLIESVGENIGSFDLVGGLNASAMGIALIGMGGPVHSVTVTGNQVLGSLTATPVPIVNPLGFSGFTRGLYLGAVQADVSGNTLEGFAQDLLVQFASGGATTIDDNTFHLAGVDISEPNSGSPIAVSNNNFDIQTPVFPQSLIIRGHHDASSTVTVSGNTFTGHTTGIVVDNSSAVVIDDNDFTAAVAAVNAKHVVLDTDKFGSLPNTLPVGATITNNAFFGAGTGLVLRDGNPGPAASPKFANVVVGTDGNENIFHSSLDAFIVLDAAGPGGPVDFDLDARENVFGVTGGDLEPSAMLLGDLFDVEDKIIHGPDNTSLGVVTVVLGNLYVTTPGTGVSDETIQRAVTVATAGDTVNVEAGTYSENVTITKDIDILGDAAGGTTVTAASGNVFTLSGTGFGTADNQVSLDYLNLDGAGTASAGVFINGTVNVDTFSMSNADVENFVLYGFYVDAATTVSGSPTVAAAIQNINLSDLDFANNGIGGGGGTADIQFFGFNTNASLTNITAVGNRNEGAGAGARGSIQFRGVGLGDGTGVAPMGTVTFDNVDVIGKYRNQMIGIQRYSDVSGLSFTDVQLGGGTSEITGTFGAALRFDAVGSGSISTPATVALGNTEFRGLAGSSAQRHEIEFAPDNGFTFLRADGTGTTWSGVAAGSLTVSQAHAVEDRILHYVDKLNPTHTLAFGGEYNGFADIQAGRAFINDEAEVGILGEGSINRGIEVVLAGTGIVHVEAGTFNQGVTANKTVTLLGAQAGIDARTRSGSESIISNAGGAFAIQANGVVIDGFTIQDQSNDNVAPGFGYAVWMGSAGNQTTGTEVLNNIFQNNHAGIGLSNTGVDQVVIQQNLFRNNSTGLSTDIYYDQFVGGQLSNVLIDNNVFTNTSFVDAHWAVGISNTAVSAVTDLTISNNEVTNSGRGFYFFGTQDSTLTANIVTGANDHYAIGLFKYGSEAAISNITISGNQLTNAVGGAGISIDDGTAISIVGNTITGNETGIEQFGGEVSVTGSNVITGNSTGINIEGGIALVEGNNLNTNTIGVLIQDGGVADLGQTGPGTDFTGLGVSAGGNDFSGYTAAATTASGAIVNLNTGGAYSDPGPQGLTGPEYDVTAFNNTFNALFTTPGAIDTVIYHDTDDSNVGFVDYADLLNLQVSLAPLPTIDTSESIDEGGSVTVYGEFTNVSQPHTVTIDWGDGSPDTTVSLAAGVFTFSASSPLGTYDDDPDGATQSVNHGITVTVTEDFGPDSAADSTLAVTVNNDIPNVALSDLDGDNVINEGQTFNLVVGSVVDSGQDTIVAYEIFWGDGTSTFVAGDSLASPANHSHLYADGLANPSRTITIDVQDEDGTWVSVGSLMIDVNNVDPTATNFLAFNSSVSEGSTATVFFVAPFTDPGSPDTPFHFAYDFNGNGIYGEAGESGDGTYAGSGASNSAVVPASFLADDDDSPRTVNGRIIDNDGGYTDYSLVINITNVAPVVNAGADATAFAGVPFNQTVSFTDPGAEGTWAVSVDWNGDLIFDETFNMNSHSFNIDNTYGLADIGSTYTVTVQVDDNDGGVDTDTFTVMVEEDTFRVLDIEYFASGFDVTFNRVIDLADLNLYDGNDASVDLPDLTVVGDTLGTINGSITWNAATNTLTWVKTGGVLSADDYTVTLESDALAFQDTLGNVLDGDGDLDDSEANDDYVANFSVAASTARVVSLPDFARGAGQDVNLPATGVDLPISIDQAAGVTSVDVDVEYDPALLNISGATLGSGPLGAGGWTITTNAVSPGLLKITISGTTALSGSNLQLIRLNADVPGSAPYADSQIIRLTNLQVNESAIAAKADYAVHKAAYLGDADGNGIYTGFDSALISRVVVLLDSGFDAHDWTDPVVVADATSNGALSGQDASLVAQEAALIDTPEIPALPLIGPLVAGTPGIDPELSVPEVFAAPGDEVTIPVTIEVFPAEGSSPGVISATFDVFYNNTQLTITTGDIQQGTFWDQGDGWSLTANVPGLGGQARLVFFNTALSDVGTGDIAYLTFTVDSGMMPGDVVNLNIQPVDPNEGNLTWTDVDGSIAVTYPADFEPDGDVDGDDLVLWQDGYGTPSNAAIQDGDADRDGDVDGRDFLIWQRQNGNSVAPVAAVTVTEVEAPAVVPVLAAAVVEEPMAVAPISIETVSESEPIEIGPSQVQSGWLFVSTADDAASATSADEADELSLLDAVFTQVQTGDIGLEADVVGGLVDDTDDTILDSDEDTELESEYADDVDAVFEAWV